MPDVYAVSDSYRASLLDADTAAAQAILLAYQDAYRRARQLLESWTTLRSRLEAQVAENAATMAKIRDAMPDGPFAKLSDAELAARMSGLGADAYEKAIQDLAAAEFQSERWKDTVAGIKAAMDQYAAAAAGHVVDAQGKAIDLSGEAMERMVMGQVQADTEGGYTRALAYSYAKPDDAALRAMVGYTRSGAPLSNLFESLTTEMVAQAKQTLLTGIALGTNPRVLARQLDGPLGIPLWRSLTIARTETLRAYRDAQRASIAANSDILDGWVWRSARDRRTCEVCWANDGKEFPLTIADRSPAQPPFSPAKTQAEATRRFKESGLFVEAPDWAKGKEGWFKGLPLNVRNGILSEWERLRALGIQGRLSSTGTFLVAGSTHAEAAHVRASRMEWATDVDWSTRPAFSQFMVDASITGTFRHEYGHIIKNASPELDAFAKRLMGLDDIPAIPSFATLKKYHGKGIDAEHEIMAEYFAEAFRLGHTPGTLPHEAEFLAAMRSAGLLQ